ncbi:hypothetical protein BC567DRAFT_276692 [Phyllosticta citribraziliensis]
MDPRNSWLGRPDDKWMARHGFSLSTEFKVDAPVVQSFDDPPAQDSGDALWRHLGFQVEPCTTRRERAMRTHRLTYEKDPKVDRNDTFDCNLTPKQQLDMPKEFWYNRCLRCGIPEAWFPTKDHNWRNCKYRCWYCQSMAHANQPCQGYFRQIINGVRQVISEEPPGLGWYERNTRPQTPPRASPPPALALPEETYYPTSGAPENKREPEVISLLSSSPSADGRDQEELREVPADVLEYPAQEEEFETRDNPQDQGLDARRSYHGAEQQEFRGIYQPQPFSKGSSWMFPNSLGEADSEDVSYFPPPSTHHGFPEVVQSVEWDPSIEFGEHDHGATNVDHDGSESPQLVQSVEWNPSMEFGYHDPGATNVDYDGPESPQTVICIDSDEDENEHDIGDDVSENNESEDDNSDSDDYGSERNHNSPEVIDLTSSSSPASENSFHEGYAPEPQSPLQLDEEMGFVIDESEDQESDGFPEEVPSIEVDENVSQCGSDVYPSSDTIMADDGDVDDAHSDRSRQYSRGLGYLARDSLSPRRRERSERPPEPSDNEFYHLSNQARDCLLDQRKSDPDASPTSDNQSNHSDPVVRTHRSPLPEYFEGTPLASQDNSCHLGLMARNSLSPLRKDFQRSFQGFYHGLHQSQPSGRGYYAPLSDTLERPSIALDDSGFNNEADLPSQHEVAGTPYQASEFLHPQLERSPRFALSSDQDLSYITAVEYINHPTEPQSDPHEPTLEFSEELHTALSHFFSSPSSQNIPEASAVQRDEYTVWPHQPQDNHWEAYSTPSTLRNSNSMTLAEEDYQTVEWDSAAQDNSSNGSSLLQQDLEAGLQNSFSQDDDDSNSAPRYQGDFRYAPTTDLGAPNTSSTSLDHVESSSEHGMQADADTKDGLLYDVDTMEAQLHHEHLAEDDILLNCPPSSQTVVGDEESPTDIDGDESIDYASGSSESGESGVGLRPVSGKTWNMDALEAYYANQLESFGHASGSSKTWNTDSLEAYYANQRELESILGDSASTTDEESDDEETGTTCGPSPTSGEESDDEETGTIRNTSPSPSEESEDEETGTARNMSPVPDEESDDEGTVVIHYLSPVSGTERDEDSDDYVRYDEDADTDDEHHIERSPYDKRRMAGLYSDDDIHEEQDSGDVQAYEDEDCEDHEEYDGSSDSSDTVEADHENDDVRWTNYTYDTMASLYQGRSGTAANTMMEDDEEKRARAPSSVTANNNQQNNIPEWLFASQTTPQQQQQPPTNTINIHAAQHYIASPAPALSRSPLSTATTESADGPAYDADHTWERAVTDGIPDAVEEISIDELHALAQTGHTDAMRVCYVNRTEAMVDAAAANALVMLLADDQQQQQIEDHQQQQPPPPSHFPELSTRSPSPLSSPSAQQLQSETWRASSAPAAAPRARSSRSYGELGEQQTRRGVPRARTRSRSPERWRVPSFEDYRQRE